jgi:hypothetical protein
LKNLATSTQALISACRNFFSSYNLTSRNRTLGW